MSRLAGKIAIITGSTRPGRNNIGVAQWVLERAVARGDADYELVDIADFNLPLLDEPYPAGYHSSGSRMVMHPWAFIGKTRLSGETASASTSSSAPPAVSAFAVIESVTHPSACVCRTSTSFKRPPVIPSRVMSRQMPQSGSRGPQSHPNMQWAFRR